MRVVGLTGGIGAGKSTVSSALAARGAVVIDADAITREVQEPGTPVFEAMVERFGPTIVRADGTLDRQAVADIVFPDPDALKDLNAIVHPAVGATLAARLAAQVGTDHVVILDVPLLVESGRDDMAGIIVVDVDPETAVGRLVAHRGFSEADARSRISRQVDREARRAKADFLIDNEGELADLQPQLDACWAWIQTLPEAEAEAEGPTA